MREGYLTLVEAARVAGVSRAKLWRMVRSGRLRAYEDPRDARVKLIRRDELDAALQPVPLDPTKDDVGKEAA